MNRLAIIDWGIGGISIYKLVNEGLGLPVIYFSDTGATPYGKMSRRELIARLDLMIRYLRSLGVTHLVIGCNAASTAISELNVAGVKIEGVIDSAVELTAAMRPVRLGLIGGRRTVLSGVYRRAFKAHDIKIKQRIAQPLSGLIESGDVSSPRLRSAAKTILGPLRDCSHILMACTHYPAISPILRDLVSTQTILVDPASSLIEKVVNWDLARMGDDLFLTTGDSDLMRHSARLAFGVEIAQVKKVKL